MFEQICRFCNTLLDEYNTYGCCRCGTLGCNQCISEDGFCIGCTDLLECAECKIDLTPDEDDICWCPECEEQYCPRCMIDPFCSDCTEVLWKRKVMEHLAVPNPSETLMKEVHKFWSWALAIYSLYELHHEKNIGQLIYDFVKYDTKNKLRRSEPEQDSTIGKIIWERA